MTAHISEELPQLLTGEATHDVVLAAAEHLRECPDCQEELVSAIVAHASLSSAQRFAPEVVVRDPEAWFGGDADSGSELPDLSSIFEQARAEAASPTAKAKAVAERATRGARGRYLAVAAAAVVLVGGGVGTTVALTNGSSSAAEQRVALAAYDLGRTPGTATLDSDGRMSIDAKGLPHITGQRYEVWLTDSRRSSMKPVGWLGSNGTASLTVPTDLMGTYSYIEVSRQQVSSDSYAYSGISVLRGRYTA